MAILKFWPNFWPISCPKLIWSKWCSRPFFRVLSEYVSGITAPGHFHGEKPFKPYMASGLAYFWAETKKAKPGF